jgi:hypothetical protein
MKNDFDSLTIRCLTTPFDKQFIRCVDESHRAEHCLASFQARQGRQPDRPRNTDTLRRW